MQVRRTPALRGKSEHRAGLFAVGWRILTLATAVSFVVLSSACEESNRGGSGNTEVHDQTRSRVQSRGSPRRGSGAATQSQGALGTGGAPARPDDGCQVQGVGGRPLYYCPGGPIDLLHDTINPADSAKDSTKVNRIRYQPRRI